MESRTEVICRVVREVAELPDRTSPTDHPGRMMVTESELTAILDEALPRPSGGLDAAVVRDLALVLDWVEVEEGHGGDAHDDFCEICVAMKRLRNLPPDNSGELREAVKVLRGNMATIVEEAKVVTDSGANARTIWLINKIATAALATTPEEE